MPRGRDRGVFCRKEERQIVFQVSPRSGWQSLREFLLPFAGIYADDGGFWADPQVLSKGCSGEASLTVNEKSASGVGTGLCWGWAAWHTAHSACVTYAYFYCWGGEIPLTHGWMSPQTFGKGQCLGLMPGSYSSIRALSLRVLIHSRI